MKTSLEDEDEETSEKEVEKEKIEAKEAATDTIVAKTETVEPVVSAKKNTTKKKAVKETEDSPSIGELAEENRRLQEENSKLTDLLNAKSQVPQQESQAVSKPVTVSGLLDELLKLVKEERVVMLLTMMQEDYFKLKYKTHTPEELTKLRLKISERFLEQSLEGRVDAARKINKE